MRTTASGPLVVARVRSADDLVTLARHVRALGFRSADAHAPHFVEALDEALALPPSPVRPAMLLAAAAAAAGIFWLQWWNAVEGYPINSGGRPLNSWPAFLFTVFETGVLGAAVAGFVAMLWACGLPRLHHPLFDAEGASAITDDGFFLTLDERDRHRRVEATEALAGRPEILCVQVLR